MMQRALSDFCTLCRHGKSEMLGENYSPEVLRVARITHAPLAIEPGAALVVTKCPTQLVSTCFA
jgi:hypothetical protein